MKKIFAIYCCWLTISLLTISLIGNIPLFLAKIIMASSMLNLAFVCIAPIYSIIYSKGQSHKSDSKYLNYCLNAGMIRAFIWFFAFFGLTNQIYVLSLNVFGIVVFALLESKFKRISNEYFKY